MCYHVALSSPGGASLGGPLTASLVDGVATFSGLTINKGGELEVNGTPPGGIYSSDEVALDGSDLGYPGNDAFFVVLPRGRAIVR